MLRLTSLAALLVLAGAATAQAADCESLRAGIDARIKATGVSDHKLTIVDANAVTAARVVGRCDLGTKKILYSRPATVATAAAAPPPAPATTAPAQRKAPPPMLTECKDGSVAPDGDCSKARKKVSP